ncbi:hypothetical protein NVI2019_GHJFPKLH_03366 [Providencia alcalifaciens]|nr:hypothetical protein NVI2019_GHJFPKLH_03366 [Providencia alcalifaciens]
MTKYAMIAVVSICVTILGCSFLIKDRLSYLNIDNDNTVVQVKLDYEIN